MLKRISIRNYRLFRSFDLDFDPDLNILVGDNDAGKSTLLEAIGLALTLRLNGRNLAQELSPYLFNIETTTQYISDLRSGKSPEPPEIIIDLYLDNQSAPAVLRGTNHLGSRDEPGVRVRICLNDDYRDEYEEFASKPDEVTLVPTEYYKIEWLSFAGNGITFRSIPATASLIDASNIRLQSGADYYMQGIINSHLDTRERVELARSYRSLRETFSNNPSIDAINTKLKGNQGDVSNRELSLGIDVSQKSSWESNLVPHLDQLPFMYVGKGEQSTLKILLALNRRVTDAHVVLVEEPENHLSFSNLNILVTKIADKCAGKQVFLTTHSSYVLNKLGLDSLVLLTSTGGVRLSALPAGTQDYFKKLSGYDTLRLVLAKQVILVEGPSDELIVQRAYRDVHGRLPIEDGIDVINVRGLSAKRFLDIAIPLGKKATVVTDNDGKPEDAVLKRFDEYKDKPGIAIHVGKDSAYPTLEPQLLNANGRDKLNQILGTSAATDQELRDHMTSNKTTCALAIFETTEAVTMPEYIRDAVAAQ